MSEINADQDRIESELARTRSRMDNRLDELQERLSPGQVLDDLMGYFRGSEGGEFARSLMDSVRNNPMPAALTGIGVTWLMACNPHPPRDRVASEAKDDGAAQKLLVATVPAPSFTITWKSDADLKKHLEDAESGVVRGVNETDADYRGRVADARAKVLGLERDAEDTADTFAARVQHALTDAQQRVSDIAAGIGDKVTDASQQVGKTLQDAGKQIGLGTQAAQQMGSNLVATITANPVLLGALGLAFGAVLGALVPPSEAEEASLSGLAGQARAAATNVAQGVLDQGAVVAGKVLDAGSDTASGLGLTSDKTIGELADGALSGDLIEDAKKLAHSVLKSGEEALRSKESS